MPERSSRVRDGGWARPRTVFRRALPPSVAMTGCDRGEWSAWAWRTQCPHCVRNDRSTDTGRKASSSSFKDREMTPMGTHTHTPDDVNLAPPRKVYAPFLSFGAPLVAQHVSRRSCFFLFTSASPDVGARITASGPVFEQKFLRHNKRHTPNNICETQTRNKQSFETKTRETHQRIECRNEK